MPRTYQDRIEPFVGEQLLNNIAVNKTIPDWISNILLSLGDTNLFDDPYQAAQNAELIGLTPVYSYDEDTLFKIFSKIGFEFRFNIASRRIETKHCVLTGDEWMPLRKKDKVLSMLSRAAHKTGCFIKEVKVGEGKNKETRYKISRIMRNVWGSTTDTIIADLFGLVVEHGNGQIPAIHPFREFLNAVREHRELLTPERMEQAKELAKTWLNYVPHIEPTNPHIGNAASLNIIGGLAYRLLESEKRTGYRPKMQRELVLLASPSEMKIGKTAIVTSIAPNDMHKAVLENFTLDDDTKMLRKIKGKFLVVADDLNGFTARQGEKWKSFQTQTRPSVDEKFENADDFPRTDWMVGTANQVFIPSDQALHSRILVCEMSAKPDSKSIEAEQRGKDINHWFEEYRLSLFAGALTLIEEGINIEADNRLWAMRRDAIESAMPENGEMVEAVKRYIELNCSNVKGNLRLMHLMLALGLLTYRSGDEKGEAIPRTADPDDEKVLESYMKMASGRAPEYRNTRDILNSIGWRDDRRSVGGQFVRIWKPQEGGFAPWK